MGVPALRAGCALVKGAADASPPCGLRSRTRAADIARIAFPGPYVRCMFFHAWRRYSFFLPLCRRSHRLSALHAEGRLSPRQARGEIRRGNPDDGAPRTSRRRLRHLAHAPSRIAPLRRRSSSTSSFPRRLKIGRRKARAACASSKEAVRSADVRGTKPPEEGRLPLRSGQPFFVQ